MKTAQNTWGKIKAKLKDAAGPVAEEEDGEAGKSFAPTLHDIN